MKYLKRFNESSDFTPEEIEIINKIIKEFKND